MEKKVERLFVVPADDLIILDGEPLRVEYDAPDMWRILQWYNGSGHIEFADGSPAQRLTEADYEKVVFPYVQLWFAEQDRLLVAAHAAEVAVLSGYNRETARFARLRAARNVRLLATDYLLSPDYPLSAARASELTRYRMALRDLPAQEGAPWDGGGPATPWPVKPSFVE